VGGQLDLTRLTELQRVLGADLPELIAGLVSEIDAAISNLASAVADGDLPSAAHAAHAARNSALMLDAQPLLHALGEIESGARTGDRGAARGGLERLQSAWPELKRLLEDAPPRDR
jgi:HPt (histidine-containing phosphotransfer) domain-containing protein